MLCPVVFPETDIGDGSESRSSRAVAFVGCYQLVEFADCGFFQHLATPLAQMRDVEPPSGRAGCP